VVSAQAKETASVPAFKKGLTASPITAKNSAEKLRTQKLTSTTAIDISTSSISALVEIGAITTARTADEEKTSLVTNTGNIKSINQYRYKFLWVSSV
jgi:hypothetical protein